jgi:hypothetical protein
MTEPRTVELKTTWQDDDQEPSTVHLTCTGDMAWCVEQVARWVDRHKVAAAVRVKNIPAKEEMFPPRNGKGRAEVPAV